MYFIFLKIFATRPKFKGRELPEVTEAPINEVDSKRAGGALSFAVSLTF